MYELTTYDFKNVVLFLSKFYRRTWFFWFELAPPTWCYTWHTLIYIWAFTDITILHDWGATSVMNSSNTLPIKNIFDMPPNSQHYRVVATSDWFVTTSHRSIPTVLKTGLDITFCACVSLSCPHVMTALKPAHKSTDLSLITPFIEWGHKTHYRTVKYLKLRLIGKG